MRVAISNIAWERDDDELVASLLRRHAVDAIDVAPGKYFPRPADATDSEIEDVRSWWAERDVEITGMQALLFGTTGLNLFGTAESRSAMLDHLEAVCRIGGGLGAPRLVFGSPKNRDRSGLDDRSATAIAVEFFRDLGDRAGRHGVTICLEPNPACYGSNYMLDSDETAAVVRAVDHDQIRMQLDTGALCINQEDVRKVVAEHGALIGHIHASEPQLVTLGDGETDHRSASDAIRRSLPDHVVSIEMLPAKSGKNIDSIERAVALAVNCYR